MGQREAPGERLPQGLSAEAGLTSAQVVSARQQYGANEVIPESHSGWGDVVRDTARDPMLWFLLLTSALFAWLGQAGEAATLLVALVPLLGMDAYLHRRTLLSTAGLASRMASTTRTLRDGAWTDLPYQDLVPGDLVEVAPGAYFPADGVLVGGSALQCDESVLTGESLPVRKSALDAPVSVSRPVRDEHWGTAGTRLLTGVARMRVVWTGGDTRYGEIARTAAEGGRAATPLQQAIGGLVTILVGVALAMCLLLAAVRLWQGHGWVDALLSAVTLAVAALPEEFPVVYTFFLGLGVFRLARRKALVRRAVAVENIGRTTCIVSDKTGTITSGTLTLAQRVAAAGWNEESLLATARLASRSDSGDPLDAALQTGGADPAGRQRLADHPFTEARRRETAVWRDAAGRVFACTKGAPETILGACASAGPELERWRHEVERLAGAGHKVIGCARRDLADSDCGAEPEDGFTFAGLLAFVDPVRPGVREAITECMAAGMRVVMVTGDHPATAAAIARQIGLGGGAPKVVVLQEGAEHAVARDGQVDVVARAAPLQKLILVKALQERGEIVAVTGDGVNDVPALRAADIGIAMGERGTRAAREVAPIVLLDDNFGTLVRAIAEGRQLFVNLRLAFAYLLLVHMPLVLGAAAVPLLGKPLLYLPIHIVWLELVIHPTAMLAFQDLPARGPLAQVRRERPARFFSPSAWLRIGVVGGFVSLAVVGGYSYAWNPDAHVGHARAMAIAILLLCSAGFVTALTGLRKPMDRWIAALTVTSLVLLVQVPVLSAWLHLVPLHLLDWTIVVFIAGTAALVTRWFAGSLADGHTPAERRLVVQGAP